MNAEHYRLFIAVLIPERIRDALAAVQTELKQSLSKNAVTWTRPEQLHLTLKFLGSVEAQRVNALTERLQRACERLSPMCLRAKGAGAFPDVRFPRVLWIGLEQPEDKLAQAHEAVESVCRDFSSQEPDKTFSGHVILGRAKHLTRPEAQI